MRRSEALFYLPLGMEPNEQDSFEIGDMDPKDFPETVDKIMREYVAEVRKRLLAATTETEWDELDALDFLTYSEFLEVLNFRFEDPRETLRREMQNDTWRYKGYTPPPLRTRVPYGIKYLKINNDDVLREYQERLSPNFESYFTFLTKKGPPFKAFFFGAKNSLDKPKQA